MMYENLKYSKFIASCTFVNIFSVMRNCNKFLASRSSTLPLLSQNKNKRKIDLTRMQQFLRRLLLKEFFTFNSLFSTPAVPCRYFHFHIFIVPIIKCILAFIFYKQYSFNRPWCTSCGWSCGLPSCSARCWVQRFSTIIGLCRSSIVILSLLLQKWSDVRCSGLIHEAPMLTSA